MYNFCNYHDYYVYNMAWCDWVFNGNIYCSISIIDDIRIKIIRPLVNPGASIETINLLTPQSPTGNHSGPYHRGLSWMKC